LQEIKKPLFKAAQREKRIGETFSLSPRLPTIGRPMGKPLEHAGSGYDKALPGDRGKQRWIERKLAHDRVNG